MSISSSLTFRRGRGGGDEPLDQVLVDDAVRGGKEGQYVLDEELLVVLELRVPVIHVLGEILHA